MRVAVRSVVPATSRSPHRSALGSSELHLLSFLIFFIYSYARISILAVLLFLATVALVLTSGGASSR
jgi:hypothetical protein